MINYADGQFTDLLPFTYRSEPKIKALGYAVKAGMAVLLDSLSRIQIYENLDTLPDDILGPLCQELRLPDYDVTMTADQKRALIEGSAGSLRSMGTLGAVQALAEEVFGECQVADWYDYSSSPYDAYTFKVFTQTEPAAEDIARFRMLLERVKPKRCYLTSVETE